MDDHDRLLRQKQQMPTAECRRNWKQVIFEMMSGEPDAGGWRRKTGEWSYGDRWTSNVWITLTIFTFHHIKLVSPR